jgi:hypothetical protein
MSLLRRVLYAQALLWAVTGLALAFVPRFMLHTVFGQVVGPEDAWVRIAGVESIVLAMLMVLVAQRSDQVWWWSWAFVLLEAGVAVIAVTHVLFGLPPGSSSLLWWLLAAVGVVFAAALLLGLGRTGQERPLP